MRELRNALRCTKGNGPQPAVILSCEKRPEHDRATLTLEDTVNPGEAAFLSEPGANIGDNIYWRARLDRPKLEDIAERWEETNTEM